MNLRLLTFCLTTMLAGFTAHATEILPEGERSQRTVVFADEQFMQSQYGVNVSERCLNPGKILDARQVDFYVTPGLRTIHLLSHTRIEREGDRVAVRRMTQANGAVTEFIKQENYYPSEHFRQTMMDHSANRVVFFLGLHEVKSSGTEWTNVANHIKSYGNKNCYVSLPPLGDDIDLNLKIIAYNRRAYLALKDTNCRVADPSHTLNELERENLPRFKTFNDVYFDVGPLERSAYETNENWKSLPRNHSDVVNATCEAFKTAMKGRKGETKVHFVTQDGDLISNIPEDELPKDTPVTPQSADELPLCGDQEDSSSVFQPRCVDAEEAFTSN